MLLALQIFDFLKRKLPAISSLIVGVCVGLLFAGGFTRDVSLLRRSSRRI